MQTPFDVHSLDHLSPSSCALWEAAPAMWCMQYLLKHGRKVGAAAYRGTAVEAGVVRALSGEVGSEDWAVAEFDRATALLGDTRRDKERDGIAGMVSQALIELRPYGLPSSVQRKVELMIGDVAVPFHGYCDMEWDRHGCLTDLKTLWALPSSVRVSHARQVAFYVAAINSNYRPLVTYCTPKKAATYQVDEPARHLDALARIGATIQRFLALSKDPMELAMLTTPDYSSFYWSDPATRQAGFEVWGY